MHPDAFKVLRNGVPELSAVVLGRHWGQDALPKVTLGGQRVAKRMPKRGYGTRFGIQKLRKLITFPNHWNS